MFCSPNFTNLFSHISQVAFDKITARIQNLTDKFPPLDKVDPVLVAQKVVQGVYAGVTTSELDNLAAETAAYMTTVHPQYETLAARLAISNLHKATPSSYEEVCDLMFKYINPRTGDNAPLMAEEVYRIVKANIKEIQAALDYERDYGYDYFGFKTLERSYLVKVGNKIVERPQHTLMRCALGIHKANIEKVIETYNFMSQRYYTHATPTLFNAGTPLPQMSSCFLLTMVDDSIDGIYSTLKSCALISKSAGG